MTDLPSAEWPVTIRRNVPIAASFLYSLTNIRIGLAHRPLRNYARRSRSKKQRDELRIASVRPQFSEGAARLVARRVRNAVLHERMAHIFAPEDCYMGGFSADRRFLVTSLKNVRRDHLETEAKIANRQPNP
jgi:hypothetical protein